jgi:hypothetical protein
MNGDDDDDDDNNNNPINDGTGPNIRVPTITQHIKRHCYCLKVIPTIHGQTAAIRHKLLCILLQNSLSSVDSPCSVNTVDTCGHVCANQSCNRLRKIFKKQTSILMKCPILGFCKVLKN